MGVISACSREILRELSMSDVASSLLKRRLSSSMRSLRVASFLVIEGFIANYFQKRLLCRLHFQCLAVLAVLSSALHPCRPVPPFETKFASEMNLIELAQQDFQLFAVIAIAVV